MKLFVKNGYVLVEPVSVEGYSVNEAFKAGKVVVGAEQDLNTIIFYVDGKQFDDKHVLVSVHETVAWLKEEEKEESKNESAN